MAETFPVSIKGIGKPDYTREVSRAIQRAGLELKYHQTLKNFYVIFTPFASPFAWVKPPLAVGTGTHTAGVHATIMTNAIANFVPNELVGCHIHNVTDRGPGIYGSSGIIIANTVNTVTVAALTGGVTNQWNLNDAYAIGSHLVDSETGVDLPYTLPQGYTCSEVQDALGFKEDAEVWILIDTFWAAQLSVSGGGVEIYRNRVFPFSTATFDPTGAVPHLIDFQVINQGTDYLQGSLAVSAITEAVGTPPLPAIKTVKCKHCRHQWDVPNATTNLICPKCGKLTIVYDFSSFRGTP